MTKTDSVIDQQKLSRDAIKAEKKVVKRTATKISKISRIRKTQDKG